MAKDTYHHKDLKNTLIQEGVHLINEQGIDAFSMRKLSAICNVSHMAPYKHFADKEDFLKAAINYIEKQFYECLKQVNDQYQADPEQCFIELGKAYVKFMVTHPDYLKYFFLRNHQHSFCAKSILEASSSLSLGVYRDCSIRYLKAVGIDEENYEQELVFFWALPMGLSTMFAYQILEKNESYLDEVERIFIYEAKLRKNKKPI